MRYTQLHCIMFTFTSNTLSTPCSVRLTCSLCYTRQSIPNITAVCSHSSFQSGSGIWTVADHSIGKVEVRTGGCTHAVHAKVVMSHNYVCSTLLMYSLILSSIWERNLQHTEYLTCDVKSTHVHTLLHCQSIVHLLDKFLRLLHQLCILHHSCEWPHYPHPVLGRSRRHSHWSAEGGVDTQLHTRQNCM